MALTDGAAPEVQIGGPSSREQPQNLTPEQEALRLAKTVRTLMTQVQDLETGVASLQLAYKNAGHNLGAQVATDLAAIKEAREDARRITTFLQGTELFGRYAQDADHHFRIANRWRVGAVTILVLAPLIVVCLAKIGSLSDITLSAAVGPVLILFGYASLESYNHRRREFDRRRIALRVSAIEAFTKKRREEGRPDDRKKAELLLDEFVRKHFIHPDLDSNDMTYIGPKFSFVTIGQRHSSRDTKTNSGQSSADEHPSSSAG